MHNSDSDVTEFVLLTTQRSGSTLFRLWLNSHSHVRCHSEIFLRWYRAADGFKYYSEKNKTRKFLNKTIGRRTFTQLPYNFIIKWYIERYLHELYHSPSFSAPWTDMTSATWRSYQPRENPELEQAVGYQLMYAQLNDYMTLKDWIRKNNISIIHLIRQNALKLLLSRKVIKMTGDVHFSAGQPKSKIFMDPKKTLRELDRIVSMREAMKRCFPSSPYLEVTYEGFLDDPCKTSESVTHFLEIEKAEMRFPSFMKKLSPDRLEELIDNYDEIVSVLEKTDYQSFLD